jgi:allantoin racemase
MRTACYLGRGFGVVTTLGRTTGRARDLAEAYGASRFLRTVRACEIGVLELEDPASDARRVITEQCRRAVVEDSVDAVVLGCATRTVESLVALGLRTGSRGEFATPPAKPYAGVLRDFQIPGPDEC